VASRARRMPSRAGERRRAGEAAGLCKKHTAARRRTPASHAGEAAALCEKDAVLGAAALY
jgi:hypothetical protein